MLWAQKEEEGEGMMMIKIIMLFIAADIFL
jgi:hypothetical protein